MISEKEMMVDERRRIQEINKIRETTKEEIGKKQQEVHENERLRMVKEKWKRWKGMNATESNEEIE